MSSNLDKSIEKELTCSICTELLFDPITTLDCLHTNCGSCSKSWFASQAQGRDPRPTCPICREVVRETRPNAAFTSLLADYIRNNPDKRRSDEEVRAARAIYKPGDKVIVAGAIVTAASSNTWAPASRPIVGPVAQPSRIAPTYSGARGLLSPLQVSRMRFEDLFGVPHMGEQRMFEQFMAISTAATVLSPVPSPPRTGASTAFNRREPGRTNTIAEIISFSGGRSHIRCDACSREIDTALHYECSVCSLFHLCATCFHTGKTCPAQHQLLPQKQVLALPTPHLETGIFCDVCDDWLDEPRSGRFAGAPNSFFWLCTGSCNRGRWTYCLRCVRRGDCCDHELHLYTNHRTQNDMLGVVRGTPHPANGTPRAMDLQGWLQAHAAMRWHYSAQCHVCSRNVLEENAVAWYHCSQCPDGQYDVCNGCSETLANGGECQHGHKMTVLTMGEGGNLKVLWRPEVQPPDMYRGSEGRAAVAVAGNWIESENSLRFPVGAELKSVRTAFQGERNVMWCWGVYCGQSGIFDRALVRI